MFDPPAGFDDMLGDAEHAPHNTRYTALTVNHVGIVVARKPAPAAIPLLATTVRDDIPDPARSAAAAQFVQTHLADGEWERLTMAMIDDQAPDNTIQNVSTAIATWGTARPHQAVVVLALQTAYLWRAIRVRLLDAGIPNPMTLPSMHPILDLTEKLMVESMTGKTAEEQQTRFFDRLYGPPPTPIRASKGRKIVPPPGFSEAEMAASWQSWTAAQGAR